jgi:hypothetical protein
MTSLPSVNEFNYLSNRIKSGELSWRWPVFGLLLRCLLFLSFQLLFWAGFSVAGNTDPWRAAADWWPIWIVFANLVCGFFVLWRLRTEKISLHSVFGFVREHLGKDLLALFLLFLVGGPLAFMGQMLSATWLFGNPQTAADLMFRPLPLGWVIFATVAFPLTVGLTELSTYFGYVMPRLQALIGSRKLGLSLAAVFLSLQHVFLPLLFDARFILYRAIMYFPFAIFVALVINWRPRLLPYMMLIHALLDLSAVAFLYPVAIR